MANVTLNAALLVAAAAAATSSAHAGTPQYDIIDLGVVSAGDAVQGNGISSDGTTAVGRTLGSNSAFSWTAGGGLVGLPKLPTHGYATATGASNSGMVVGTATTTFFGSSPLPVMWQGGAITQLPLPAGETFGRAFGVNNGGTAVGSVGSGVTEFGVMYAGGSASVITTAAGDG
ncbi:MAG: hypothetical protein KDA21_14795, partial [Phycisphaerales bacterium]|nr:hypothetical protein [Phycisphaerales bacterium]